MHVAARARLVLARRPWIYWAVVAVLATLVAFAVNAQLSTVAAARAEWGTTRTVLVADEALEPGDPIRATATELPVSALAASALSTLPRDARLRQRVDAGEVLTELDVTARAGPAARAEPGTVVVALSDPLSRGVVIGLSVQISADGIVIAEPATVVDLVDDVIFVAVARQQAPTVAAAAQLGVASLLYVP